MQIIATPFCMTPEYFRKVAQHGLDLPVGSRSDYDHRLSERYDESEVETVLEKVWERFQNLEDPHVCPDGGRSMMVGDLVRLDFEDGSKAYHMVAAMGFKSVDAEWMRS